jgi:hypothetical protein
MNAPICGTLCGWLFGEFPAVIRVSKVPNSSERSSRARLAALERWSRLDAQERSQATAAARRAFLDTFRVEPNPPTGSGRMGPNLPLLPGRVDAIYILAIVANALGKHERAARLAGAAAAEALDEETFQKAWHEGRAMALEEALAYAREEE